MSKYFFLFLTLGLFSCSIPQANDLASEVGEGEPDELNREVADGEDQFKGQIYSGHFEYSLKNCKGTDQEGREGQIGRNFMRIQVSEDNEIELLRPSHSSSLGVSVKGVWDDESKKLSSVSGFFGIADEEDWSSIIGRMLISDEQISGQLNNIKVLHNETSCSLALEFSGELLPSEAV